LNRFSFDANKETTNQLTVTVNRLHSFLFTLSLRTDLNSVLLAVSTMTSKQSTVLPSQGQLMQGQTLREIFRENHREQRRRTTDAIASSNSRFAIILSGLSLAEDPSSCTTGMILQRVLDQSEWIDLELFNSEESADGQENHDGPTKIP
jgi:hypothetical protein